VHGLSKVVLMTIRFVDLFDMLILIMIMMAGGSTPVGPLCIVFGVVLDIRVLKPSAEN
jgi:hypothetical protein